MCFLTYSEFKDRVKKEMGILLTDKEFKKIVLKYGNKNSSEFDENSYKQFNSDYIKGLTENLWINGKHEPISLHAPSLPYGSMIQEIRDRISERSVSYPKDNRIKEESHHEGITREELRKILQCQLHMSISESQIDEIFKIHDPMQSGEMRLKSFINELFLNTEEQSIKIDNDDGIPETYKLQFQSIRLSKTPKSSTPSSADEKTNSNFMSLLTVNELEKQIRLAIQKHCRRPNEFSNSFLKIFNSLGDISSSGNEHEISTHQIAYILRHKLQLNVSDEIISQFCHKYDKSYSGHLNKFALLQGLHESNTHDLFLRKDAKVVSKTLSVPAEDPAWFVRQLLLQRMNRDGRSPIDLIQTAGKVTKLGLSEYIQKHFKVLPSADFLNRAEAEYSVAGHIDSRALLQAAMIISTGSDEPSLYMIINASNDVIQIPASLDCMSRFSPDGILDILRQKLQSRMDPNRSLSAQLFALFGSYSELRTAGYVAYSAYKGPRSEFITKPLMRALLKDLYISVREEDFLAFFAVYDIGTGLVNISRFLKVLFPAANPDDNPLCPNAEKVVVSKRQKARFLRMITGKLREPPSLSGVTSLRVKDQLSSHIESEAGAAAGARSCDVNSMSTEGTNGENKNTDVTPGSEDMTKKQEQLAQPPLDKPPRSHPPSHSHRRTYAQIKSTSYASAPPGNKPGESESGADTAKGPEQDPDPEPGPCYRRTRLLKPSTKCVPMGHILFPNTQQNGDDNHASKEPSPPVHKQLGGQLIREAVVREASRPQSAHSGRPVAAKIRRGALPLHAPTSVPVPEALAAKVTAGVQEHLTSVVVSTHEKGVQSTHGKVNVGGNVSCSAVPHSPQAQARRSVLEQTQTELDNQAETRNPKLKLKLKPKRKTDDNVHVIKSVRYTPRSRPSVGFQNKSKRSTEKKRTPQRLEAREECSRVTTQRSFLIQSELGTGKVIMDDISAGAVVSVIVENEYLIREKLKRSLRCPMKLDWIKVCGGFQCLGGDHYCSDKEAILLVNVQSTV